MNVGLLYLITAGNFFGSQMCSCDLFPAPWSHNAQAWKQKNSIIPLLLFVSLHAHHLHLKSTATAHHSPPWSPGSFTPWPLSLWRKFTVCGSGSTGGQHTWGQDRDPETRNSRTKLFTSDLLLAGTQESGGKVLHNLTQNFSASMLWKHSWFTLPGNYCRLTQNIHV